MYKCVCVCVCKYLVSSMTRWTLKTLAASEEKGATVRYGQIYLTETELQSHF